MLLELIVKLKVATNCVISYNNQKNKIKCYSKQKIFEITKFIVRFSLFPMYTLFTICELGHLLHVHKCIENFESLLFLYISNFFVSGFYCINVTRSMY